MARKKSRAKVKKVVKEKVDTVFDCPFCDYSQCVECKINRKIGKAKLSCRVCSRSYESSNINDLTAPIDVYCEWRDECEKANS